MSAAGWLLTVAVGATVASLVVAVQARVVLARQRHREARHAEASPRAVDVPVIDRAMLLLRQYAELEARRLVLACRLFGVVAVVCAVGSVLVAVGSS